MRLRGGTLVFGDLDHLDVRAPLTTHGVGARGFNVYDGTLQHAEFDSITTTGDGAIGVQVSRDLPQLDIRGDLTTSGGTGSSLVRGVQTGLAATALSVKPGGRIGRVTVGGRIASEGDRLTTVEVDGELDSLTARGGISAAGRGARTRCTSATSRSTSPASPSPRSTAAPWSSPRTGRRDGPVRTRSPRP
ncbi:hypothetical protein ACWEV4_16075 [Streptomyces sp. NPDC003860]